MRLFLLPLLLLAACAPGVDVTARAASWPNAFHMYNGRPVLRFVTTTTAGGAESNLTAAGGAAVTYTLVGGERICLQSDEAVYAELIVAASYTASGAKSFTVPADQSLWANCFTLDVGQTSVTTDCVTPEIAEPSHSVPGFEASAVKKGGGAADAWTATDDGPAMVGLIASMARARESIREAQSPSSRSCR